MQRIDRTMRRIAGAAMDGRRPHRHRASMPLDLHTADRSDRDAAVSGRALPGVQALLRARRTMALESRLAQAELSALRAQLEPHFLFNALNTATSLVRAGHSAEGVDVLTRLGELLRHTLHAQAHETTLGAELE